MAEGAEYITYENFIKTYPSGKVVMLSDAWIEIENYQYKFNETPIVFDCETCKREMNFSLLNPPPGQSYYGDGFAVVLKYYCRNCGSFGYSFSVNINQKDSFVYGLKYGQYPRFKERAPKRFNDLLGNNRDLYYKGRHSESLGFGIASFSYYRRLLELQKDSLFDQIISVAQKMQYGDDFIEELRAGKSEGQFSKTSDILQPIWPEDLKIGGFNPMYILYGKLSQGIHGLTDEECLGMARDIRIILFEFTERLGNLLADKKELEDAMKRLAAKRT